MVRVQIGEAITTLTYNGKPFLFREDGYFNMTKAAQQFDKPEPAQWLRQEETRTYLAALRKTVPGTELTISQRGRSGGTYGHPNLAVFFARWLSIEFSVWCDAVIDDILKGKAEVVIWMSA